jgi:hypothetical protein
VTRKFFEVFAMFVKPVLFSEGMKSAKEQTRRNTQSCVPFTHLCQRKLKNSTNSHKLILFRKLTKKNLNCYITIKMQWNIKSTRLSTLLCDWASEKFEEVTSSNFVQNINIVDYSESNLFLF